MPDTHDETRDEHVERPSLCDECNRAATYYKAIDATLCPEHVAAYVCDVCGDLSYPLVDREDADPSVGYATLLRVCPACDGRDGRDYEAIVVADAEARAAAWMDRMDRSR